MVIGPHIWGNSSVEEKALKNVFSWLTRSGIGVKFGSRSISWYQQHQCAAIDVLTELAIEKGVIDKQAAEF